MQGVSVDPLHPRFATAHALFYERPSSTVSALPSTVFAPANRDWTGWRTAPDEPWVHWWHPSHELPDQGWKIHVSAVPSNAASVLESVTAICHAERLSFKYLATAHHLLGALAKDADRGSAGKFVTIYPNGVDELHRSLLALDELVSGAEGPYILSDLRWKNGPLYVRYGAFARLDVIADGTRRPAVRDMTTGRLVADVREARFSVPSWVQLPGFLQEQLDALGTTAPSGFPRITAALHHSNAGGVYEAELASEHVVLKEARPHAGWTPDGRDAVARLRDEESTLRSLPAEARAPRVITSLEAHGHLFLALEKVAGRSLHERVAATNPLVDGSATANDYIAYRAWALGVLAQVRLALEAVHSSGRTHGDLHPRNILVDDAGGVRLLDFEMSLTRGQATAALIGAPGFTPPRHLDPFARDLYSLACVELHVFVPLTSMLELSPSKPSELVDKAVRDFGLLPTWSARVLAALGSAAARTMAVGEENAVGGVSPTSARQLIDATARALARDADPSRDDRLWPGDPRQFSEASYSVGHGALGVAVALAAADVVVPVGTREWVRRRILDGEHREHRGLLDGLAGAVWACRQLGWDAVADDALERLAGDNLTGLGADLYGGLPGVGLVYLHEAVRDARLADRAMDVFGRLQTTWAGRVARDRVVTDGGGLLAGASGLALLSLRLFEHTRDAEFLAAARRALLFDSASFTMSPNGALEVNEGWRTLPYLGYGSAGVGAVLAQYLRHVPDDDELRGLLNGIASAASAPFTVQAGLLRGRAGLIAFLGVVHDHVGASDATTAALTRHVEQLRLHSLPAGDTVRFVGDGLLRASCDLATGAAGVLTALLSTDPRGGQPLSGAGIPYLASPLETPVWGRPNR